MRASKNQLLLVFLAVFALVVAGAAATDKDPAKDIVNHVDHTLGAIPGESCTANGGVNCPALIPDNDPVGITSTFDIAGCATEIEDVNIGVDIIHTFIDDLIITVESPAGTPVTLWDRDCGSEDDMMALFDDEGITPPNCPTINFDSIQPNSGLLSSMDGETGAGTWSLSVSDNVGADIGELLDWSVELTCAEPVPTVPTSGLAALAALLSLAALAAFGMRRRFNS